MSQLNNILIRVTLPSGERLSHTGPRKYRKTRMVVNGHTHKVLQEQSSPGYHDGQYYDRWVDETFAHMKPFLIARQFE